MGILQVSKFSKHSFKIFFTLPSYIVLSLLMVVSLMFNGVVYAQTTNDPTTVYDDFSGVQIISDPNYSTGVRVDNTSTAKPIFLGFDNLTDTALSVSNIKSIQSVIGLHFNTAKYIALEKGNVKDNTESLKITSRIEIDRKSSEIYNLEISYVSEVSSAFVLTLSRNDQKALVYVNKLNSTNNNSFTISQKNNTSTDLIISATNKEASLQYVSSLGYKVPDFTITFTNYRSVFE